MTNDSETVREVCALIGQMKEMQYFDDDGALVVVNPVKMAARLMADYKREMAAKDAEIERLKEERNHARLDAQRKFSSRIELLERALKPVMECNSDFDSCAWMADQLDEEQMDAVDGLHTAVREAQRIMKEGESK